MTRTRDRQRAAFEALLDLFSSMKRALRQEAQAHGASAVGPMHLRMLSLCRRQPRITQQALADHTGRDKGQVARLVKDLLDHGLLSRHPHPEDRRSLCLTPTPAGLAACKSFEHIEAEVAARMFGWMGAAELAALTDDLRQLGAQLDTASPE